MVIGQVDHVEACIDQGVSCRVRRIEGRIPGNGIHRFRQRCFLVDGSDIRLRDLLLYVLIHGAEIISLRSLRVFIYRCMDQIVPHRQDRDFLRFFRLLLPLRSLTVRQIFIRDAALFDRILRGQQDSGPRLFRQTVSGHGSACGCPAGCQHGGYQACRQTGQIFTRSAVSIHIHSSPV